MDIVTSLAGMQTILDRPNHALPSVLSKAAGRHFPALPSIGASNDNTQISRVKIRESFSIEEFVATRRRLKIQNQLVSEGSVGRILKVRSPGRLYDVSFPDPDAAIMTLSHCDIARCMGRAH